MPVNVGVSHAENIDPLYDVCGVCVFMMGVY